MKQRKSTIHSGTPLVARFVQYHRRLANLYFFERLKNMRNQKNNVYICGDIDMAAILDFLNGSHKVHTWPYFCL